MTVNVDSRFGTHVPVQLVWLLRSDASRQSVKRGKWKRCCCCWWAKPSQAVWLTPIERTGRTAASLHRRQVVSLAIGCWLSTVVVRVATKLLAANLFSFAADKNKNGRLHLFWFSILVNGGAKQENRQRPQQRRRCENMFRAWNEQD